MLERRVGRNLFLYRCRNKISLVKFAAMSAMNRQLLRKIEAGEADLRLRHIERLCSVMNMTVDEILAEPKKSSH